MSVQAHATARTAARSRLATLRGSGALLPLALFAGAALISGFTILRGGAPFDEGLALQAARRVAHGQLLYRDFIWPYGPAQPYLLGAWFHLLGPSLLSWRVLRVLLDAGVAVSVWALVRRDAPPWLALTAWLAAACAMAQPTSATPFPGALLFDLLALGLATRPGAGRRAAIGAGLLCALAAAWRLDFALYGAAAVAVALALRPEAGGVRLRLVGAFAASALLAGVLVYLPFVLAIGPADLYDALIGKSLRDRAWWTLPFPLSYHGGLRGWPPGHLARDLKDLLAFYVPLILVCGVALVALSAAVSALRERSLPPRVAGLLVLAGGFLLYLLSRGDEFHVTPLLVVLAAGIPLVLAAARSRPRPLTAALLGVLGLLLAYGALNRGSALLLPEPLARIHLPVADGAEAAPAEARSLERMARLVRRVVPPGSPIYTITRRSDLVRINQPLVYVLTDRDNPLRADYDIATPPRAQRQLVAALTRARPRAIVRWTSRQSTVREPNLRGRPSGSRLLDRWVAARYRLLQRDGFYEVLVPR